ncbi:MAG: DUF4198 domain-containing protein [Planctomycetaceae bacterium]|jgi:hypothetical protein|nr:DUF4198 domain-containing protein [Planctomycetaceae bacterium]
MPKKFISLFIFSIFLITVTGCSTGKPDFAVERVEGSVTLDGSPVEGVTVGFSPADSTRGKPAVGRTDAQGKFTLTATQGGEFGKGTMMGKYLVSFSKDIPSREPTPQELADLDNAGITPNIPNISIIPKKYNDPQTSGLTVEVIKGKNNFSFDLQSK